MDDAKEKKKEEKSVLKFIIKRIIVAIITLFFLVTISFFLVYCMPGNPIQSNAISVDTMQALEAEYKLDQPIFVQYRLFLKKVIQGDLGNSFQKPNRNVNDIILQGMKRTLRLGMGAFLLATVFGIGLGVMQAATQSAIIKKTILFFVALGMALPNFMVAFLLMIFFGVFLGWFPVVGTISIWHYVLPTIALAIYPTAMLAKVTHATMKKIMNQTFILFAQAKGLRYTDIIFRHALKNAMIPILTTMGTLLPVLLTGSFAVENIFSIQGLGAEMVHAISNRDYALIVGLIIVMGTLVIVVNMVLDSLLFIIDHRLQGE